MKFHSKNWYWLVIFTLLLGYALGAIVPTAIHFFGFLSREIPTGFRMVLMSFLLGLLGTTVQLSIHFASEYNSLVKGELKVEPTYFEFVGYLLKQLWGGITAVIFIAAIKLGFIVTVSHQGGDIRPAAIFVISFAVGLCSYKTLKSIPDIIKTKAERTAGKGAASGTPKQ